MNEAAKFKVGDVVRLNSGGPPMTVTGVRDPDVLRCMWLLDDGTNDVAEFSAACVTKAKVA